MSDADITAAKERADRDKGEGGHPAPHRIMKPEDYEEKAFPALREELDEKREEWKFDDEDVSINFYTHLAGGNWTKKFKDVVSDAVHAKARAHCRAFCDRFHWPKTKVFHFSAHGEIGANTLAREWCMKGNHYFTAWMKSVGLERFRNPEDHPYADSMEFLDWAVDVDVASHTWAKVMELRNFRPTAT